MKSERMQFQFCEIPAEMVRLLYKTMIRFLTKYRFAWNCRGFIMCTQLKCKTQNSTRLVAIGIVTK